jgi:hypothetical protein
MRQFFHFSFSIGTEVAFPVKGFSSSLVYEVNINWKDF